MPIIPALRKPRQGDHDFKASLHSEILSQNTNHNKNELFIIFKVSYLKKKKKSQLPLTLNQHFTFSSATICIFFNVTAFKCFSKVRGYF